MVATNGHMCANHDALESSIGRLEQLHEQLINNQTVMVTNQSSMTKDLNLMANALTKLEDTNIQIVALRGEVAAMNMMFTKTEKEHDEIFKRLREHETIGCKNRIKDLEESCDEFNELRVGPRLDSIEKSSSTCSTLRVGPRLDDIEKTNKQILWGGLTTIVLSIIGVILKTAFGK